VLCEKLRFLLAVQQFNDGVPEFPQKRGGRFRGLSPKRNYRTRELLELPLGKAGTLGLGLRGSWLLRLLLRWLRCLDSAIGHRSFGRSVHSVRLKLSLFLHLVFSMNRILSATSTIGGCAVVAGVVVEFFTYDGKTRMQPSTPTLAHPNTLSFSHF
jgi:hypothetical protein